MSAFLFSKTMWKVEVIMSKKDHVSLDPNKLLVIELDDETSVPKVFYKGEELTGKVHIHFDWKTKERPSLGGLSYEIKRADVKDDTLIVKQISSRTGEFACDTNE
ncbi:hypothetical protein [Metabacillus fastidiosus]|uniref:hypothetical protein n=1 Tax=Metabacillus fastidiosus TaxID=1458 RepID=UPI003D26B63F